MSGGHLWPGVEGRCQHCAGGLGAADVDGFRRCERCGRAVAPAVAPIVRTSGPPWPVIVAMVLLIGAVALGFEVGRRDDDRARTDARATSTSTTTLNVPPTLRPSDPIDLPDPPGVVDPVSLAAEPGHELLVDRRLSVAAQPDGRIDVAAIARPLDQRSEVIVRLAAVGRRLSVLGSSEPSGVLEVPSDRPPAVAGGTTFVRSQTQVLAFAADGRMLWATTPEEPIGRPCARCSLAIGDTFVAVDPTGRLVGRRSAGPGPVWTRGFGTAVLALETDGEVVVVIHAVRDALAISAVDPGTGAILRSTAVPCGDGEAEGTPDDVVVRRVPETGQMVIASAGSERRALCAARLDPQAGTVAWSLRREGLFGLQDHVLVQDGLLVLQPRGEGGAAWIDLQDGTYRSASELALPVAAGGGLVAFIERESGMGRPTIVALDRDTGRQRWSVAPTPIQIAGWEAEGHVGSTGATDPPAFAVTASTTGLHALSFDVARRRITVWNLDERSGRATSPRAFGLPEPVAALDPLWSSAFLLLRADADHVVVQAGPWVAFVPLVGTQGSWVWTSV